MGETYDGRRNEVRCDRAALAWGAGVIVWKLVGVRASWELHGGPDICMHMAEVRVWECVMMAE